jgi:hypothetical protein
VVGNRITYKRKESEDRSQKSEVRSQKAIIGRRDLTLLF